MNSAGLIPVLENDRAGCAELCELLEKITGIHVIPDHKGLVFMANRLARIMTPRKLSNYQAYIRLLKKPGSDIIVEFISAMTTNTTHFFRENAHFVHLREFFPALVKSKQILGENEIRVWCAASSTGQEPFSIAMTALEAMSGQRPCNIRMLASDIDRKVLERASQAEFTEAEMESVPPAFRQKYFQKLPGKDQIRFQAHSVLTDMVRFAMLNLNNEQFPFQHKFDIIFCRNILIYFKLETVEQVMRRLTNALAPNGLLYLGHTESAMVKLNGFQRISSAVFQREEIKNVRAS